MENKKEKTKERAGERTVRKGRETKDRKKGG